MTIFEKLRADHAIQRALADKLLQTHGDSDDRARLFKELKFEMSAHEKAEERFFYIPLIECDLTQEKARHSIAEHHELDEFLLELEVIEFSSPAWIKTAGRMIDRLRHHLDEEEHEIFQLAGKALTQKSKQSLATDYLALMEEERS